MIRRRRRGFIIIFGWKYRATRERQSPVEMVCPACGSETSIIGKVGRRWFTLFFIPVLPLESGGHRFSECTSCKAQFDLPIEQRQLRRRGDGSAPDDLPHDKASGSEPSPSPLPEYRARVNAVNAAGEANPA